MDKKSNGGSKEKIGKYKIIKLAGEGAFGKVFQVEHIENKKEFAIKQITKKNMNEQLMENLRREVKISYELTHENLIKCFNTMESKNNFYIVFEYCSGGDLANFLKEKKMLEPSVALDIIKQARDAYKYLMNEKVLHRDIKLENILLKAPDNLKIKFSDFGCSKIDPVGNTICGTPKYMALELLEGCKIYDYKVDLWSMGLCFWELLFGYKNFPFSLRSREHLKSDIKNFSGKNLRFPTVPKYPEEFYDFFRRILEVSPRLRMDCEEFLTHPIFNFDGTENFFNNGGKNQKESSSVTKDEEKTEMFKHIKDHYKNKITEIELIRETTEDMRKSIKTDWNPEFKTKYESLLIILIKKAIHKADIALSTLVKKKDLFKLEKFEEFLKYPNEYVDLKSDLKDNKEKLKTIDKEIYQKLLKDCYKEDYLENVNDCLYRGKAEKKDKNNFINDTWKYVYKNYKSLIEDYEKAAFEKNLLKTTTILKGKVLEKIKVFY
jgi:serine/threonine protein kinase